MYRGQHKFLMIFYNDVNLNRCHQYFFAPSKKVQFCYSEGYIGYSKPWFVAADVCRALEIANPTDAIKRLDEDERARFNLGRQGETNIVNEPGLYTLVLGSHKPEAKAFKS